MSIPKPMLRNIASNYLSRHVQIASVLSVVGGMIFWYSYFVPRRDRINNFYKNYDADAAAEEILANRRKREPELAEERDKVMAILQRRQAERESKN
ncbi:Cytochrome c oxidase subunit 6C-1 [Oopsacas minuta]|uniref:Cytochrome c oxidase subunit 6C-1 n=1 Tax=Oopsacas minuta TaxID=111878 RepID=A0AAV7KNA1_9METZ|nr:Cytochrome c oxidase subunit 6C-1 [Oopsacas minuta]